jgi:mRNA interferase HigB
MHIISRKALRQFWEKHADSKDPLTRWYQIVERTDFDSLADLRKSFPSADKVEGFVVFNIAGNKYRLITSIHFNRHRIYIRHVLTHRQYDEAKWKS